VRAGMRLCFVSAAVFTTVAGTMGSLGADAANAAVTPTWAITPSPNPGATSSELGDVSCVSTTNCTAVGFYQTTAGVQTLIESWNGTSWSVIPNPNSSPSTNSGLAGVSCVSATSCTAVGWYSQTSGYAAPLVESWDGSTWSVIPSPDPVSDTEEAEFSGVSCVSPTSCVAVGVDYPTASTNQTLVESWDGSTWSIVPSPNPSGATQTELQSIVCFSAASCMAVGSTYNGTISQGLVESWHGSTWSITPSPNPAGSTEGYLRELSCASAASCMAIGSSGVVDNNQTLAESWDGSAWSIIPSPTNPSGAQQSDLNAVFCVSAANCMGVGASFTNNGQTPQTMVESWNGSAWTIIPSPTPSGAVGSGGLDAVACTTAVNCIAVGAFQFESCTPTCGAVTRTVAEVSGLFDGYSYAAGGGTGTAPASGSGLDDTTITLAANPFANPGYIFSGWSDGTTTYPAGATYTLGSGGSPIVFTAQWTKNTTDTVAFRSDGGAAVGSLSGPDGSSITLPPDTASGYHFAGWYTAALGGTLVGDAGSSYTIPAGGSTLYAQWTADTAKPTVSAVRPGAGPLSGGTAVTVRGTNFVSGATVEIGQGIYPPVDASSVNVVSPTEITATTGAARHSGRFKLTVTTGAGTSAQTSGSYFTYDPLPYVSAVSPNSGPASGGTAITITGSGFVNGVTVVIGQGKGPDVGTIAASDVTVVSPTKITAVTGGGATINHIGRFIFGYNVYVTTPGGTSRPNFPSDGFTYN
jgi:uncharacterized repeat protein (TIGR02543 family)